MMSEIADFEVPIQSNQSWTMVFWLKVIQTQYGSLKKNFCFFQIYNQTNQNYRVCLTTQNKIEIKRSDELYKSLDWNIKIDFDLEDVEYQISDLLNWQPFMFIFDGYQNIQLYGYQYQNQYNMQDFEANQSTKTYFKYFSSSNIDFKLILSKGIFYENLVFDPNNNQNIYQFLMESKQLGLYTSNMMSLDNMIYYNVFEGGQVSHNEYEHQYFDLLQMDYQKKYFSNFLVRYPKFQVEQMYFVLQYFVEVQLKLKEGHQDVQQNIINSINFYQRHFESQKSKIKQFSATLDLKQYDCQGTYCQFVEYYKLYQDQYETQVYSQQKNFLEKQRIFQTLITMSKQRISQDDIQNIIKYRMFKDTEIDFLFNFQMQTDFIYSSFDRHYFSMNSNTIWKDYMYLKLNRCIIIQDLYELEYINSSNVKLFSIGQSNIVLKYQNLITNSIDQNEIINYNPNNIYEILQNDFMYDTSCQIIKNCSICINGQCHQCKENFYLQDQKCIQCVFPYFLFNNNCLYLDQNNLILNSQIQDIFDYNKQNIFVVVLFDKYNMYNQRARIQKIIVNENERKNFLYFIEQIQQYSQIDVQIYQFLFKFEYTIGSYQFLRCKNDNLIHQQNNFMINCIEHCPDNFHLSEKKYCQENFRACKKQNGFFCSECKQNYRLLFTSQYILHCFQSIIQSQEIVFRSILINRSCVTDCKICINQDKCIVCEDNFTLINNNCIQNLTQNQTMINYQSIECSYMNQVDQQYFCKGVLSPVYYLNESDNTFQNYQQINCLDYNQSLGLCNQCQQNYYLSYYDRNCQECIQYDDQNNLCQKCGNNSILLQDKCQMKYCKILNNSCLECVQDQINHCSVCKEGYEIVLYQQIQICRKIVPNCQNYEYRYGKVVCIQCKLSYQYIIYDEFDDDVSCVSISNLVEGCLYYTFDNNIQQNICLECKEMDYKISFEAQICVPNIFYIQSCILYDSNFSCQGCINNYMCFGIDNYFSEKDCQYCINKNEVDPYCLKYNQNGCLECKTNFIINGFSCIFYQNYVENCDFYDQFNEICQNCTNGYQPVYYDAEITQCIDNIYIIQQCIQYNQNNECKQCHADSHCLDEINNKIVLDYQTCNLCIPFINYDNYCENYDSDLKCTSCKSPRELQAVDGINRCIDIEFYVKNCFKYNESNQCIQCQNDLFCLDNESNLSQDFCQSCVGVLNCDQFANNQTECVSCKIGFQLVNGLCIDQNQLVKDCITYTQKGTDIICSKCKFMYYCLNEIYQNSNDSNCSFCLKYTYYVSKCIKYSPDYFQCQDCYNEYNLVDPKNCVSDSDMVQNCSTYNKYTDKCQQCQPNFFCLDAQGFEIQTNCRFCASNEFYIQNCLQYNKGFSCKKCIDQYLCLDQQEEPSILCNQCRDQETFIYKCQTYQLFDCVQCKPNYLLHNINSKDYCVINIQNCLQYEKQSIFQFSCSDCSQNYTLTILEQEQFCLSDNLSVENCQSYDQDLTCVQCQSGYIQKQNSSEQCTYSQTQIENCEVYSQDDQEGCVQCSYDSQIVRAKSGNGIFQHICIQKDKLIQNCIIYDLLFRCYQCESDYQTSSDYLECYNQRLINKICQDNTEFQNICQQNKDGSFRSFNISEQKQSLSCLLQVEQCKKCDEQNPQKCTECQEGFLLYQNECHYSCKQNNENCKKCKDDDITLCQECNEGFKLNKNNQCVTQSQKIQLETLCLEIDTNCAECDKENSYLCDKCYQGFYLNDLKICQKTEIVKGDSNCSQYIDDLSCAECDFGYQNNNGKCEINLMLQNAEERSICHQNTLCYMDQTFLNQQCTQCRKECEISLKQQGGSSVLKFGKSTYLKERPIYSIDLTLQFTFELQDNKVFINFKNANVQKSYLQIQLKNWVEKSIDCYPKQEFRTIISNHLFINQKITNIAQNVSNMQNPLILTVATLVFPFWLVEKIIFQMQNKQVFQYYSYLQFQNGEFFDKINQNVQTQKDLFNLDDKFFYQYEYNFALTQENQLQWILIPFSLLTMLIQQIFIQLIFVGKNYKKKTKEVLKQKVKRNITQFLDLLMFLYILETFPKISLIFRLLNFFDKFYKPMLYFIKTLVYYICLRRLCLQMFYSKNIISAHNGSFKTFKSTSQKVNKFLNRYYLLIFCFLIKAKYLATALYIAAGLLQITIAIVLFGKREPLKMFIIMMAVNEMLMIIFFFTTFIFNSRKFYCGQLMDGLYFICIFTKFVETIINIFEMNKIQKSYEQKKQINQGLKKSVIKQRHSARGNQ